jgi:hypothetical protein
MPTNPTTTAAETIAILRDRLEAAVRYSEAYEGTRSTVAIDGSMLSPSDRALPRGEEMYQSDDPNAFELWREEVDAFLSDFTVPEDSDSEAPDDWTFSWEDGCLVASLPELPDF